MKSINYKVPNGKMFRIDYELYNDEINKCKITGDFFLYPEEEIFGLEKCFKGTKDEIKQNIDIFFKKDIKTVGFEKKDLLNILSELLSL